MRHGLIGDWGGWGLVVFFFTPGRNAAKDMREICRALLALGGAGHVLRI